jgi:hypothetical protein
MITIYKYKVKQETVTSVEMPRGARLLTAKSLGAHVWVWALVDTEEKDKETRQIAVLKTGQDVPVNPDLLTHIETVQFGDGELVLHVFECHTA